jgi:hypothetical protein
MEFNLMGVLSALSIIGTVIAILAPAIFLLGAVGNIGAVGDRDPDAWVVSFSLSVLAPIFRLGMGIGGEFSYEILYIKSLGTVQDYYSGGISLGIGGATLAFEVGPVWNVKEVNDYKGLFFSTTFGASLISKRIFPKWTRLKELGFAMSWFWTPKGSRACGVKAGPAASSGMWIYGGTVSLYRPGGPFSWCRNILDWFKQNIQPPSSPDPVEGTIEFYRHIKQKLEEFMYPTPTL